MIRKWNNFLADTERVLLVWVDQKTHGMPLSQRLIQSKALNLFNAKMAEKGEEAGEEKTSRGFGEGNGTPLQYSCLGNPMDGGAR